ncbi:hypothetical protein EAO75_33990 [Streptomyces sp. uw30]|uniref:hypothetical protein n=1 Tax=Streptomyces sp. uw30 TaxID=1828179 RepID=UPI0011CD6911|nr:hypothetical protein [Streptomyces sp. uw30]TXS42193.1 hypothetical protein EAO75_33990 [Streptomyces sp. uw30]
MRNFGIGTLLPIAGPVCARAFPLPGRPPRTARPDSPVGGGISYQSADLQDGNILKIYHAEPDSPHEAALQLMTAAGRVESADPRST